MSKRYYDGKAKELYELKMGSLTDEEYKIEFLEVLKYFLYLQDEKTKVKRFISRLSLTFKDQIEYDEPR